MQEHLLRMSDIERSLEEMTRYLSENHDPETERCARQWHNTFRRYVNNSNGRDFILSKKLYEVYHRYAAAYNTRDQRPRTPRYIRVIPSLPLPPLTPQYRSWIESIGGPYRLRAVPIPTF